MSGTDHRSVDRRAFMGGVAAAGLAAAMTPLQAQPRSNMLIVNTLGTLNGFDAPPGAGGGSQIIVDTRPEMITDGAIAATREAGVSAVHVTVGHVAGPGDPFEHTVGDIGRWDRIIRQRQAQLIKVSTAADILRAQAEGKIGVVYASQNCTMLGERIERVDIFADLGLRVFQLTYNAPTLLGDGSIAPENRPLTPFGQQVVARLAERRMICDLAHSGTAICLDAARRSPRPIMVSHTGCRALVDVPRNKTDPELRLVAERGGYIGIYFMPFLTDRGPARAVHVAAHLDHAINVCGEDHVGLGTDGPMQAVPNMEQFMEMQRQYIAQRRREGIAAPGEREDAPFFVVDLTGPNQFRDLERLLRQRGYSTTRIEKIFGRNFLRFAEEVWG